MATENRPRDDRCLKAFTFIWQFHDEHNFAPTYPQIGKAIGLKSTSSVHAHIKHLEADGLVVVLGARGVIPTD